VWLTWKEIKWKLIFWYSKKEKNEFLEFFNIDDKKESQWVSPLLLGIRHFDAHPVVIFGVSIVDGGYQMLLQLKPTKCTNFNVLSVRVL